MHELLKNVAHYAAMLAEGIAVILIVVGIISHMAGYRTPCGYRGDSDGFEFLSFEGTEARGPTMTWRLKLL